LKAAILKFLKANGEQLDAEIAKALNISVAQLTIHISQLSATGDVICCNVTKYVKGTKIEGVSCRLSCDLPMPARGRKPGGPKKDDDSDLNLR
jgi:hypothetical protein